MIRGFLHPGSGLGNQLHRYVATRVLALDKEYDFSMIGKENFKGKSFMQLDFGREDYIPHHIEERTGKIISHSNIPLWEEKTGYYNPEFNFIGDNTTVDGEFQDERYFRHRLPEIDKWLAVEQLDIPDDLCVIGFRGGEFALFPDLFLTEDYWNDGIRLMRQTNHNMRFEVHTDDPILAKQFFPAYPVIHDIGVNWRSMRYAKYALIANSSFYIFPRLLRQNDPGSRVDLIKGGPVTIAPRYWAQRNTKIWSMPQNYYGSFRYL